MKIKFITGSEQTDEGAMQALVKTLDLCGQGKPEGQAEGLMPLKLASNVTVTPRVTVYSNTSVNKRGATSAVIKVSIPYTALKLTDDGTGVAGADANRSGGELSMHMVLALPAACAADVRGVNGDACRNAAEGQVGVIARLLSALMGPRLLDEGRALAVSLAEGNVWQPSTQKLFIESDGGVGAEPSGSLIPKDDIAGYAGYVGFDVTGYHMSRKLDEPLTRMVAKMPPLGCSGVDAKSVTTAQEPW